MGIEARHAYRFGYLQSEHWKDLRVQKLAESDAKCLFCGKRGLSNDVHHIRYPKNLKETTLNDLRVLCREHHDRLHVLMDKYAEPHCSNADCRKGGGFRIFRKCAKIIEAEIIASGGIPFTRGGRRIVPNDYRARALPDSKLVAGLRTAMKLISEKIVTDGRYKFSESIKAKAGFVIRSIEILSCEVQRVPRVDKESV